MNYRAGDEVVCIDAMTLPGCEGTYLTVGKKYVVNAIHGPKCVELVGEMDFPDSEDCPDCGLCNTLAHYDSWRFIKLDKAAIRTLATSEAEAV